MAQIYYYNADGSIKSSVKILKDGRALEVYPSAATAAGMRTWPSMEAWTQEMPREWRTVEAWIAATATATASAAASKGPAASAAPEGRLLRSQSVLGKRSDCPNGGMQGPTLHVRPPLAYFLRLPEGATTSREAIRDALASYRAFYNWGTSVYLTKRDVKPDTLLYRLDDFLVTLSGLDPRGTYTARQILNAVLARQTRDAVSAPAALAPLEEKALDEETPLDEEIVKINTDLAWQNLRILGENTRLKAEIEALQARLCTIRAAATFL
jgi:hypothetical protein